MDIRKIAKKIVNLGLVILGGIFWRMGGSDSFPKWIRGIGVASVFTLITVKYIFSEFPLISWIAWIVIPLTWLLTWGLLTISYGINSPIGKLFSFISNQDLRDIAIRGTCAICWSGAYLPSIYYRGNWIRILFCFVPMIFMPLIRVLKIDRFNPHIEEILMGIVYTLGFLLIWIF